MARRKKILCFGEALIDFLAEPEGGDSLAPRRFLRYAGGAPANAAVAVARLGGEAAFAGMLARDMFGDFLLESLQAAGVDTACVVRTDAAPTALAFVALDAGGERRFSFYRPPAADLLFRPRHFHADCFEGAAVFHVCSNSLTGNEIARATLAGLRRARREGAVVSFDLNLRPSLWPAGADPRPRLWRVLRGADLVKFSAEELAFLAAAPGGEAAVLARLWRGMTRLLVVTDGARPIRCLTREGERSFPAFPVEAVNATGAGDAFAGGILYRFCEEGADVEGLAGDPARLEAAIRFAAACGALAVTRHGSFAAMPAGEEVRAFLGERA